MPIYTVLYFPFPVAWTRFENITLSFLGGKKTPVQNKIFNLTPPTPLQPSFTNVCHFYYICEGIFKLLRSPGIDFARLHRLAGRYTTTRFLVPVDCSKIPALKALVLVWASAGVEMPFCHGVRL